MALIVLATGCRHKDEPLKPLVIVDKPARKMYRSLVNMSDAFGQLGSWRYMPALRVIWKRCCLWKEEEVKQNEPLFIINSALYKAKVEKAKAQLKKNEAQAAKA